MAYLIDSDWLIDYLADLPAAREIIDPLFDAGVAISIISYIEVYEGIESGINPIAEARFERILEATPLLYISRAIALRCARLRLDLRTKGKRVNQRAMDLLVASTALEDDLTLVTRNFHDYEDIPGLQLYASA